MRILLAMQSSFPHLGWCLQQELHRLGHETEVADEKLNYLPIRGRTTWDYGPLVLRTRLSRANDVIANRLIRRRARRFRPDLVLFSKGENIFPGTLRWLRRNTRARLVNWNLDNPFFPSNTSMWHLRSMPLLDCYGTFAQQFVPVLRTLGCRRVEYWPCYYYPALHPAELELGPADRARFGCEVVFAGSWSPERQQILEALADQDLALWGPGWDRLPAGSPLRRRWRGENVLGEDYAKAMLGAECVLNVLSLQGRGSNNLRTFEATGLGRFLLTEYSPEHDHVLFRGGEELVTFRSPEDLREKFLFYRDRPAERAEIARRGQARTLSEHTLAHRVRAMLDVVAAL